MTTLEDVTKKRSEPSAEAAAATELVRLDKEQGLSLTGPGGLLKQFTKTVLESLRTRLCDSGGSLARRLVSRVSASGVCSH